MRRGEPQAALISAAPRDARSPEGWRASLSLVFTQAATRTIISHREHRGPLRLLKPLYPEGDTVCHGVIVHPPGGIVAGDSLLTDIRVEAGAHGTITTPGAQKWYRAAEATTCAAMAATELSVADGATLEWLPQEAMIFNGANAAQSLTLRLAPHARFFGWEMLCLGRTASGERFDRGVFRQRIDIVRDDALIWCEKALIRGDTPWLRSPLGLGGNAVMATAWLYVGDRDPALGLHHELALIRDQLSREEHAAASMPDSRLIVIKLVSKHAEAARETLAQVWHAIRTPALNTAPNRPRIWNT